MITVMRRWRTWTSALRPRCGPHGAPGNLADAIDKAAKIDRDE